MNLLLVNHELKRMSANNKNIVKSVCNIAVLVTCFNRKDKTLNCLQSVFSQKDNSGFSLSVYLVDDGFDGTSEVVKEKYPGIQIAHGNGNLFWAGGMRKAWKNAISSGNKYDFFLLLNDDTILMDTALSNMIKDIGKLAKDKVILVGTTLDPSTKTRTYGGHLLKNKYNSASIKLKPNNEYPQLCDQGNANIMLVSAGVVEDIGILSDSYTHGLADFDYTLRAKKAGIRSYIASAYAGYCKNDHGNNWFNSKKFTLKQRIENLYNVKGLAYKEYLAYTKFHFPLYLPQAWLMLWIKTFFPFLWDKFRKPSH